jgi:hypothetical protein
MNTRGVDPRVPIEANVVRLWRTGIDPARADEYDHFAQSRSLPMFRTQPGFVAVLLCSRAAERTVITLWQCWDAVNALDHSATYQATVNEIEAAGFLRGDRSVETFDLDGISTQQK